MSPPMAWGGVMRPVTLRPGESLLEARTAFTGIEGDPALAERKAEFDRNLPEFLQRPFSSREQFERDITRLPGAGQEILGHIQQRAAESMPASFAQELAQTRAKREAATKAMAGAAGSEAAYQEFKRTATPEQLARFEEDYERTPEGWKPARMTPWEKASAAEEAFKQRVGEGSPEWAEYKKRTYATPLGGRSRVNLGTQQEELMKRFEPKPVEAKPESTGILGGLFDWFGGKTKGAAGAGQAGIGTAGQPVIAPAAFPDEASARAAGHVAGDIVVINGRRARLN